MSSEVDVKILIGITHEPETIRGLVERHNGMQDSLVRVGPFVSPMDAFNWLTYLKSRIGEFEEILPERTTDPDELWYCFTFEISAP